MFKFIRVSTLLVMLGFSGAALSQAGSGAALKNIQENIQPLPQPTETPQITEINPKGNQDIFIKKLVEVKVQKNLLEEEIQNYWQPYIGKAVTNNDVSTFKDWVWQQFRKAGYLGVIAVTQSSAGVMQINVSLPVVGAVRVQSSNAQLLKQYEKVVLDRFSSVRPGSTVDLLDIEQRLNDLSFDLPIEASLNLKPESNNQIALIIFLREKTVNPGQFKYGAVQVNNYGLSQFGRNQALASLNFEGFTPGALANATVQGSEGLAYGHVEYSAPTETLSGVGRVWAEVVQSRNINQVSTATRGVTSQYGAGLANQLASNRDMVYQSNIDLSQRFTNNNLLYGGTNLNNVTDNQGRLKLSADNGFLAKDNIMHFETTLVDGNLSGGTGAGTTYNTSGQYSFLTLGGSWQKNLTDSGMYLIAKARAQGLANRNLDPFNQFSLGGINGVRAYTTIDGLGDSGAVGTLELRQAWNAAGDFAGIFYDGGIVNPHRNPVPGQYNTTYALQGAGLALGGTLIFGASKFENILYNLSVAKGIGGYKGYVPGLYESTPNNWRFNFALTVPF